MSKKVTTTVVTTTTTTTEEIVEKQIVETHYLLILDKSGSMHSLRQATINGYNEQIQMVKKLEKEFPDQKYFVSLVTFNEKVDTIFSNVPASEVKELTADDYLPNGGTALVDAMGEGISKLDDFIKPEMNNKEKIVTAVVVIMTDGEENSSKNWNQGDKIKKLIERLNKDEKWSISYVGANQDAILNSSNYGIAKGNTVNYTSSINGTTSVGRAMSNTLNMRAKNIATQDYMFQGGSMSNGELFRSFAGNIDENLANVKPLNDLTHGTSLTSTVIDNTLLSVTPDSQNVTTGSITVNSPGIDTISSNEQPEQNN